MKRFLSVLIVISIVLFAGCSFPGVKNEPVKTEAAKTAETAVEGTNNAQVESTSQAEAPATQVKAEEGVSSSVSKTETDTGNAASADDKAARVAVTLYYQDGDGYLVPMTRWIENQEGIAKAAIKGLVDNAATREDIQYYGVYPVLPENTAVQGINIKDGTATIDFNKSLLGYKDEASEKNMVASVVYTLTEFGTIDNVRILVNGYPQGTLKYGADISGLLNRRNVNINSSGAVVADSSAKADVYCFKKANEGFTYLVPVSVQYDGTSGETEPDILANLLLKEKSDDKLQSEMPAGARLLGSSEDKGIITLNFDTAFTEYGGTAKEEGILKQIAYTMKQVEFPGKIKLQVEGSPAELPEGTDISNGISIPRTINDYIDR